MPNDPLVPRAAGPDPATAERLLRAPGAAARTGDDRPRYTPVVGAAALATPGRASLWHLLSPKWQTARARSATAEKGRAARYLVMGLIGLGFWAFAFGALYRVLSYFKGVEEIGALLAGKLLGVLLLSFVSILLLSNIITALSSFFLARDLDLLASAPVDWLTLYSAKLLETTLHSSWMVVLLALPIFSAYGFAYEGGLLFPLVAIAAFVPFLVLPSVIGSAVTLLLVNIFPARRTRDILSVITVLAGAGVVVLSA